jgi:NitT/TauT family transport system substrate-binding protein
MRITLIENFRAAFYAPFYASCTLGAYEAEGIEVEIKPSPAAEQTISSLLSGYGEISWGGPTRLMAAREKNPERGLLVFAEVVGRDPFFLVGRTPNPAFKLGDLRGKTIAVVAEVPTPWMCLRHDLHHADMDPGEVEIVPGRSMPDNVAALRAGEVDAIQVFHPYARMLCEEGSGYLWYAAANRGPTSYTTLNTTRDFIEGEAKTVRGMCRAMYRTQKWIAAHSGRALAEAVQSYFPEVPVATLGASYDHYKEIGIWNRNPFPSRAGFEWLCSAALSSGRLRRAFSYEECVETRFAREVIEEDPSAP